MEGCPKCGAQVSDTDLSCRQCGASFIGDASALTAEMQANPPPPSTYANHQAAPRSFGVLTPFGLGIPNRYAPLGPLPGSGGPDPMSEANRALLYAVLGIFCFGLASGWFAIAKARRVLIGMHSNEMARKRARLAYWLGWFAVATWVIGLLQFFACGI